MAEADYNPSSAISTAPPQIRVGGWVRTAGG